MYFLAFVSAFCKTAGKIKETGHFGAETHQIVALGIKEYLIKSGLIDEKTYVRMPDEREGLREGGWAPDG